MISWIVFMFHNQTPITDPLQMKCLKVFWWCTLVSLLSWMVRRMLLGRQCKVWRLSGLELWGLFTGVRKPGTLWVWTSPAATCCMFQKVFFTSWDTTKYSTASCQRTILLVCPRGLVLSSQTSPTWIFHQTAFQIYQKIFIFVRSWRLWISQQTLLLSFLISYCRSEHLSRSTHQKTL